MDHITLDEVLAAIASLNRHKAAGSDGINNDFLKDFQALLAPALVNIGNKIIARLYSARLVSGRVDNTTSQEGRLERRNGDRIDHLATNWL